VDEALGQLAAQDRLVLASYFLDDRTLTEIGRVLRVHESTISRRLEKLLKNLRKQVVAGLMARGMKRAQTGSTGSRRTIFATGCGQKAARKPAGRVPTR
jgi:RNA polymerase sigma-70 factor (ECF subfamily)